MHKLIIAIISYFILILTACSSKEYVRYPDAQENKIRAWAQFYQGLECEQQKNWKEALVCFYKASLLDPKQSRIYFHLANACFFLKEKHLCLAYLKNAEKFTLPEDYLLYFDMAKIYEKLKLYQKARKLYEKSLEIFPHFESAKEALNLLFVENNKDTD